MKVIIALALGAAIGAAGLTACSLGDDSGSKREASTTINEDPDATTEEPAASICALTSVDEVRTIFGAPVGSSLDGGRCRFTVPGGTLRFQEAKGKRLDEVVPDGEVVNGVGDLALWAPAAGAGGVLAVEVDDRVFVFEALLDDSGDGSPKARTIGWATAVIGRFADAGIAPSTTRPGSSPSDGPDPCRILSAEEIKALLGRSVKGKADGGGGCTYDLNDGATLTLGPVTSPVTSTMLESIGKNSTVDGEDTPWKRTDLDVGDGGVLLVSPTNPAAVDAYVLVDGDLTRISVNGTDGDRSGIIARSAADEIAKAG